METVDIIVDVYGKDILSDIYQVSVKRGITINSPEDIFKLLYDVTLDRIVVEISDYEMLTPVRVETEDYVVTCPKGETSIYDLAYLKSVGFDPFESGFTVVVDGTDMVLTEMPTKGDYLLILTKDNASYQLKVTSSVK